MVLTSPCRFDGLVDALFPDYDVLSADGSHLLGPGFEGVLLAPHEAESVPVGPIQRICPGRHAPLQSLSGLQGETQQCKNAR